jgi:hypothetical protein
MKNHSGKIAELEELDRWAVPLDGWLLEKARKASQGLKITQTPFGMHNVLVASRSGTTGVLLDLVLENDSDHNIYVAEIQLALPWLDNDFHWLRKLTSKIARESGYVLEAFDPHPFDCSVVLNDQFSSRGLRILAGNSVNGFLFGESSTMVPPEYAGGSKLAMKLTFFASNGAKFESSVELNVSRSDVRRAKSCNKRPGRRYQYLFERT